MFQSVEEHFSHTPARKKWRSKASHRAFSPKLSTLETILLELAKKLMYGNAALEIMAWTAPYLSFPSLMPVMSIVAHFAVLSEESQCICTLTLALPTSRQTA